MNERHPPKLRALRALVDLQLSEAASARLRKHIAACASCAHALRGMRLADLLIGDVRVSEPALDYTRMQARLARPQQMQLLKRVWLVPALAAAAALLWLLARPSEPNATREPERARVIEPVQAVTIAGLVTAVGGQGELLRPGAPVTSLRVDAEVREGDHVSLGADSLAHVRLGEGTGFIVGSKSRVALQRLRAGDTQITLDEGRLISLVQHLELDQHYVIQAAGYSVSVRGTHFEVAVAEDRLSVAVREGYVVVQDSAGHLVAELHESQRFDSTPGTTPGVNTELPLERPRTLGLPLADWPLVRLLDLASLRTLGVTGIALDGSRAQVSGELAMRVPRGDVSLVAERSWGQLHKAVIQVPPEGLSLAPDALRRLLRLHRPENGGSELDFTKVLAVVRGGTPALQRCYERALRLRPELDGRLTIRVSIASSGLVSAVTPRGDVAALPAELFECVRNVSGQWRFPASRDAVSFDIPLRLQRR